MTTEAATLRAAASRLMTWMRDEALPLWSTAARDPNGGYYEDLDLTGRPRPNEIRRVRVQPRQAYVFAHASGLGWVENARALSDHGLSYAVDKAGKEAASAPDRFDGFVHRLTPDGGIADPRRDTYDHAFFLLACAWRIGAFADELSQKVLASTLSFLDRRCGDDDGSYREGVPATLPRRQNPHMHLFEAFTAVGQQAAQKDGFDRAHRLYELFERYFYDRTEGVVREFFNEDWSLDDERGHIVEPGHMVEWCWLLIQFSEATGTDTAAYHLPLYRRAEELGLDAASGFLLDAVSLDPATTIPETRRTWVQTEYLKATLALARHGEPGTAAKAADLIDRLFTSYLASNVSGGYNDRYGAHGKMIAEAMPTSTLYHLMSAAAEAEVTAHALS